MSILEKKMIIKLETKEFDEIFFVSKIQSADLSNSSNFRPGLSKFFLESASEERGHAKKLMEYYLMRGGDMARIKINAIVRKYCP